MMKSTFKKINIGSELSACIKLTLTGILTLLWSKKLKSQDIWLLSEKNSEARDNGYHLYQYLVMKHPECCFYYVIKKGSPDENKLSADRVIYYNSWRHCYYSFLAKNQVGGQVHFNRPYYKESRLSKILYNIFVRKDQQRVFLHHGICKDNIPQAYDYRQSKYTLMISGAKPEYDYFKKIYSLPDDKIALTGLPRFDNLYDWKSAAKRQILIMPTFRRALAPADSRLPIARVEELERFERSEFCKTYVSLLNNNTLRAFIEETKVNLIFYLHFTFQPYRPVFERLVNPHKYIKIANRLEFDVQQLLLESKLLITDFSSVFFDFAYMGKPLIYYQFDKDEYRKGHYAEGYFVYERDGFGPVIKEENSLIPQIIKTINNDFVVSEEYSKKSSTFFVPHDKENCQRVYNVINNSDNTNL